MKKIEKFVYLLCVLHICYVILSHFFHFFLSKNLVVVNVLLWLIDLFQNETDWGSSYVIRNEKVAYVTEKWRSLTDY